MTDEEREHLAEKLDTIPVAKAEWAMETMNRIREEMETHPIEHWLMFCSGIIGHLIAELEKAKKLDLAAAIRAGHNVTSFISPKALEIGKLCASRTVSATQVLEELSGLIKQKAN